MSPETWSKNNQQGNNLQPSYQHGKGTHPDLKISQHAISGGGSHLAQAGAKIIDACQHRGKCRDEIKAADEQDKDQRDRKSTRLNSSHAIPSRMPSSA